ncbi:hypothetical protein VEE78_34830 [Escherichia coli]|nr:hypothetical protein VEE78_34830 [Escherichia coli]
MADNWLIVDINTDVIHAGQGRVTFGIPTKVDVRSILPHQKGIIIFNVFSAYGTGA